MKYREQVYGEAKGFWLNPFVRYFRAFTKTELAELQGVKDRQNHIAVAVPVINGKYNKLIRRGRDSLCKDIIGSDGWLVRYPNHFILFFTDKEFRLAFRKVKMRKEFYSTGASIGILSPGNSSSTKGAHK